MQAGGLITQDLVALGRILLWTLWEEHWHGIVILLFKNNGTTLC